MNINAIFSYACNDEEMAADINRREEMKIMWCSKHSCSAILVAERTSGEKIVRVGRCNVGKELMMEKWRKVRSEPLSVNSVSKDKEALIRMAEYRGEQDGKTI
jgi:hypothetical protein